MEKLPFIFSDRWPHRLRRHLAFWIFWTSFQGFLYSFAAINRNRDYWESLPHSMLESLIFMIAHMFLAYSLIYFVIPKFLLKQKYLMTSVITILLFLATACISAVLNITIVDDLRLDRYGEEYARYKLTSVSFHLALLAGLRGGLTIGGIAAAIKLMKYWYLKEQRILQLQKENTEAQLQLLKAQVHPHFLFNTLNNIYSYTQSNSPVASKMISRLSDLLRYVLYEASQSEVPLQKELRMLKDYIDLERVRYDDRLDLDIQISEEIGDYKIAPLLLLPLVENCFKHGTSQMIDQPWISLHLDMKGNRFYMRLLNGKQRKLASMDDPRGIGIMNVRKRLELVYPGRHELAIKNEEDVFIVNLSIDLEPSGEINKQAFKPVLTHA